MPQSHQPFHQAVAVITGAASGIGEALALELSRRGSTVVLADLDLEDAESVAATIRRSGGNASAMRVDVSDFAQVNTLITQTADAHGRIDFLFNNAGIGAAGETRDYSLESWQQIVAVNLNGVIHGIHAAYPQMIRQGHGHIINTASIAGLIPSPGLTSYAMTKHAVVGLSRSLRLEARTYGVNVSVFCPGVIRTPILSGGKHGILLDSIPEQRQRAIFLDMMESLRPMDVSAFARRALDQVARNRGVIIIPGWYRIMLWLDRLLPGPSALLWQISLKRFRKLMSG